MCSVKAALLDSPKARKPDEQATPMARFSARPLILPFLLIGHSGRFERRCVKRPNAVFGSSSFTGGT